MNNRKIIFLCGLHRSGTSLLYKILKQQQSISGHENTNVVEDEGQHIQTIYPIALKFGGPGKFGFHKESSLDETSELITKENSEKLFNEWSKYWDLNKEFLVEKSPPNLLKTRFLQALFPNSYFIVIIRHPIATSLATQKWSKTSRYNLIEHWITCHKRFIKDQVHLNRVLTIQYENLISSPETELNKISLSLKTNVKLEDIIVQKDINQKYFNKWRKTRKNIFFRSGIRKIEKDFESEIIQFDYTLNI